MDKEHYLIRPEKVTYLDLKSKDIIKVAYKYYEVHSIELGSGHDGLLHLKIGVFKDKIGDFIRDQEGLLYENKYSEVERIPYTDIDCIKVSELKDGMIVRQFGDLTFYRLADVQSDGLFSQLLLTYGYTKQIRDIVKDTAEFEVLLNREQ